MPPSVITTGVFDDIRSRQLRFLEEAAKLGPLTVLAWSDELAARLTGRVPKFSTAERLYFLRAVRYVTRAEVTTATELDAAPACPGLRPAIWATLAAEENAAKRAQATAQGMKLHAFTDAQLAGFPTPAAQPWTGRKKVVATGCYDWFHTGHVRFTEEVSEHGDLTIVVGNDKTVRELKGEGHPLFSQEERRYVVGSIRFVTQCLVSTGMGWLDADPEIRALQPDIYAVNEDGDKGGKREYCAKLGIEYLVLKRTPAAGLPRRSSTDLRGF